MGLEDDPLAPRPDAVTNALQDIRTEFAGLHWRKILVTFALLSLYLLGHFIPLPGLNMDQIGDLRQFGGSAIDRVSLMALGVLPWASAVALVELVGIIIPPLRTSLGFTDGHANPFHWFVILLTPIIALPQAYGVSIALEAGNFAENPGTFFVGFATANMIAGTITCIALAKLINRAGAGHGFWLVFGFSLPFSFPRAWEPLVAIARSGGATLGPTFIVDTVVLLVSVVAVCLLVRKLFHAGVTSPAPIVLPLLVSSQAATQLVGLAYYIIGSELNRFDAILIYQLTSAIMIIGLLWLSLYRCLQWPLILPAAIVFIVFTLAVDLHLVLEIGIQNGWYTQTSASQMAAFFGSFAFIASGVYGRRKVVGNP